ncbi:MAG: substrate-binding domain-containing protein [Kiritimatiellae bacterium]|nr:substrate-binding domain-containing protein [Kiritimatiellia bacterium]
MRSRGTHLAHHLQERDFSGIVAHVGSAAFADRLRALGIPVVNISRRTGRLGLPTVATDNEELGRVAAGYFLKKGFRAFSFLESPESVFSDERGAGFHAALKQAGFSAYPLRKDSLYEASSSQPRDQARQAWLDWLKKQPKPVAVFAATDEFAARMNAFCKRERISVPSEVAILGCDNDEVSCLLNYPPRSSVELGAYELGRRSAELLDGLMKGRPAPGGVVRVPPGGVVTRQSTDILAVQDAKVRAALAYLHKHLDEPLQVEDLCRAAGLSRRPLEQRFRKHLNRTPLEVIHDTRLELARRLLVSTPMQVAEIATRCGYRNGEVFSKAFGKVHGMSPRVYRRRSLTQSDSF